jgi:hypothetical protein
MNGVYSILRHVIILAMLVVLSHYSGFLHQSNWLNTPILSKTTYTYFSNANDEIGLILTGDALAATDAKSFYYNPEFIDSLNNHQIKFVLIHEALHCALTHFARRGARILLKNRHTNWRMKTLFD